MKIINVERPVFSYNLSNPEEIKYSLSETDINFKTVIVQNCYRDYNEYINEDVIVYRLTENRYYVLKLIL